MTIHFQKTLAKVTFLLFSSISPLFLFPAFWWRWHLLLPLLGPEILTHPRPPRFTKTNQTNIVGLVQQGITLWDEYLLKIPPNIPGYLHKTCKTQYRSIRLKIPRRPRRYYTRWFSHLRVSEGEPSGSMFNRGPCDSDPFEGGWLHPLPPRFLISGVNKNRTHIHIELSNWGNWVKIQIQTS